MYEQAQTETGESEAEDGEKVVDADFEEVKDGDDDQKKSA